MVDILTEHLSQDTDRKVAKMLSCHIEDSINRMHSYFTDKKAYSDKVRSLSFNMKINASLRESIVSGTVGPETLVRLSPQEMATEEQRRARNEAMNNEMGARRADYYQTHRADILVSRGARFQIHVHVHNHVHLVSSGS